MRRAAVLLAVLVLAGGALWLARERMPLPRLHGAPTNLLLVTLDTTRADRLGCYGHAAAETPRLDALAARGLRFEQASSVVPLTLPAHSSLMTGTFPAHHGVRDNGGFYLADSELTLAEVLRAKGYRTGGFVGCFVLDSRWGIHQGFERFFDDFELSKYQNAGMDAIQRRGDEVVEKALAWLDQDAKRPFFAWVHLYDPHTPYEAPAPFAARFPRTAAGAYDAEIAWTDSLVGKLLDRLAGAGRLDRTLVVVLGDHGESLGEHREPTHGFFVYEATVHIPLIVAGPGVAPRVVGEPVRIVDVMPTALELLGLPAPAGVQGRSLVPLARGERLELPAVAESWYPRYHYGWSELLSIRDGRYKLIEAPRRELYDLRQDPGETHDLAAQDPARADALEKALKELRARVASAQAPRGPQVVDPEVQERLEALGYVSGPISARNLEERPRGDPKDKIDLYNSLKEAGGDGAAGRLEDAIAKVRRALAADPEIVEAYTLLGNFQSRAKRYEQAVSSYRQALARDPEHQGAVFGLAGAYKSLGRLEQAESGFERARQLDPRAPRPLWQLADIWMQRGQYDRALGALQQALALKADRPSYLLKLGECYVEMKRYDEAEAALREALSLKSDLAAVHYNLALVHEARGRLEPAIAEYEAELELHRGAYRSAFNLAKLLLRAGRAEAAVQRFREATVTQPDFGTGYLYLAKALLDAGRLREAEEAARQGLRAKLEPGTAPLGHYVLADVYTRRGRTRDAARELAAARKAERGG